MERLGIPKLASIQTEEQSLATEAAAREYVMSKVSSKRVRTSNLSFMVEGAKPMRLTFEPKLPFHKWLKTLMCNSFSELPLDTPISRQKNS